MKESAKGRFFENIILQEGYVDSDDYDFADADANDNVDDDDNNKDNNDNITCSSFNLKIYNIVLELGNILHINCFNIPILLQIGFLIKCRSKENSPLMEYCMLNQTQIETQQSSKRNTL